MSAFEDSFTANNNRNNNVSSRIESGLRTVQSRCFARIGLMGNPSDGFNGKTLSLTIGNFYADVIVQSLTEDGPESKSSDGDRGNRSGKVIFVPHPVHDSLDFDSFEDHRIKSSVEGYYGGIRLIRATCRKFAELHRSSGCTASLREGFKISYDTNIPRMVGLSGSSAIVVATFKALMEYYSITLSDLNLTKPQFAQVILDVEKLELGISAGLQDRVVQTYGGLVHMDFSVLVMESLNGVGMYSPVSISLLPHLYLAYNTEVGGDSGKVHSTVRERWEKRDPELVTGMQTLGGYADEAVQCLQEENQLRLAELMDLNFAMRRMLYGDAVVGEKNIAVVSLARELGLAAKFTGSGGALVCMRRDSPEWLDLEKEEAAITQFRSFGFNLIRVLPVL